MVSSGKSGDQNDPSDELQQRVSPHTDTSLSIEPEEAKTVPSTVTRTEGKDSDATACASETDQEGAAHSPLQSVQETPSTVREKVSKDGYNWRKYGQKHVKGNEFVRSYYKCTHTNCQAKKQLQQSNEGHITDSICIGQHNHPRPQLNSVSVPLDCVLPPAEPVPQKLSFTNVEDKASVEHRCMPQHVKPLHSLPTPKVCQANEFKPAHLQLTKVELHDSADPIPESKRLKKDNSNADATGADTSTCESRVVVQTSSEVDLVNDGYRWRKYGQKLVKGNANPRSYYRCSNSGCPVKKHVERASHDSKIVITTYEGQHDHEIPPVRIVTHNVATTNTQTMATNGMAGNQSGGNSNVCIDPGSRLSEQLNGESITKLKASDPVEIGMISLSNEGPESKFNKEGQQNDSSGTKDDSVNKDI